jgi:hypothetical protein
VLPFIWFLLAYSYKRIYNLKDLDEGVELMLENGTIKLTLRFFWWILMPKGLKFGETNKNKFNPLTINEIIMVVMFGYSYKIFLIYYFKQ